MDHHGFLRVAAATPELRLADPAFNADRTLDLLARGRSARRQPRRLPRAGADRATPATTCSTTSHFSGPPRPRSPARPSAARRCSPAWPWSGCRSPSAGSCSTAPRSSTPARCSASCPRPTCRTTRSSTTPATSARPATPSSGDATLAGRTVPFGTDLLFECRDAAGLRAGRRDLRRPVDAGAAELAPGGGRGHGARQPLGQQRDDRQGRLPPAAGDGPVGPVPRRVRLRGERRSANRPPTSSSAATA